MGAARVSGVGGANARSVSHEFPSDMDSAGAFV